MNLSEEDSHNTIGGESLGTGRSVMSAKEKVVVASSETGLGSTLD